MELPFLFGPQWTYLGFPPRSESFAIEPFGSSLLNFLAIRISLRSIRTEIRRTTKSVSRPTNSNKKGSNKGNFLFYMECVVLDARCSVSDMCFASRILRQGITSLTYYLEVLINFISFLRNMVFFDNIH